MPLPRCSFVLSLALLAPRALGLRRQKAHSASTIEYYGRIDFSVPGQASFDWPGVYIETGSTGSTLGVKITGPSGAWFDVFIDGEKVPAVNHGLSHHATFRLYDGVQSYEIATGLPRTAHTVKLIKRSETTGSPVVFKGFLHGDGVATAAPARPDLKVEFIGASTTAGYGVESPSKSNPPAQDESGRDCIGDDVATYTNTDKSYSAWTAKFLGAQYHVVAQSGLGMVRNYGGGTGRPNFPEYYGSTLQSQRWVGWNFSSWKADAIVFSVGRNDFSPLGDNERFSSRTDIFNQYKQAYLQFVRLLRERYPGVQIVNSVVYVEPDDLFRQAIRDVIDAEAGAGRYDLHYHDYEGARKYGCHWHMDMLDGENLGRELADVINGILQGGGGCCNLDGACGDCGTDGTGWCHYSAANCADCSGTYDPSGTKPSCAPAAPTPAPPPPPGLGCCKWNGACGDCGNDGTGWCHDSAGNCATCSGAYDASATKPSCGASPAPTPPTPGLHCSQCEAYGHQRDECDCGVCGSYGGCSFSCDVSSEQPACTRTIPCSQCEAHGFQNDTCGCGVCGSYGGCSFSCDVSTDLPGCDPASAA